MSESKELPVSGLYKEVIPDLVYRITFWDGVEHAPDAGVGHLHTIVIGEDAAGNVRGRAGGDHVVYIGWGIIEIEQGKDNWVVVGVGPKDEVLARYAPIAAPRSSKKAPELESGDQNIKVKL
jgi:hypothetical protein